MGQRNSIITIFAVFIMVLGASFFSYTKDVRAEGKTTIYICYCPGGCMCEYETLKPGGRCVCGLATIPVEREPSDDHEYECACGEDVCDCGTQADEPGYCHCGNTEMQEKE